MADDRTVRTTNREEAVKRVLIVMAFVYLAVAGTGTASEKNAGAGGEADAAATKVGVQAAVLDYINEEACEVHGICKFGTIMARYSRLLDGVEKKDGFYVARAEFRAGKNIFTIEYHVKEQDGSYTVAKEIVLARNGDPVNEVLWEGKSAKRR